MTDSSGASGPRRGAQTRRGRRPNRRQGRSSRRRLRYAIQDGGYAVRRGLRRLIDLGREAGVAARRRDLPGRLRSEGADAGRAAAAAIIRFGELSSRLIHQAMRALVAVAGGLAARGTGLINRLSAVVTPLRAVVGVTALAALLLGISQFVDYRGVAVGAPDYARYGDVEGVAPAPQVDRRSAGSAHAYALLPVALAALAALVACTRGRWQLGRAVALLGAIAVAVSLLVDAPKGLDGSAQEQTYSGVDAKLVEGFYVQLFAAAVLVAGGLLVSRYARQAGLWRSPSRTRRSSLRQTDNPTAGARAGVT